jgi:hypothetical protein
LAHKAPLRYSIMPCCTHAFHCLRYLHSLLTWHATGFPFSSRSLTPFKHDFKSLRYEHESFPQYAAPKWETAPVSLLNGLCSSLDWALATKGPLCPVQVALRSLYFCAPFSCKHSVHLPFHYNAATFLLGVTAFRSQCRRQSTQCHCNIRKLSFLRTSR